MGALEKLRNIVNESFKESTDTESVKKLALMQNAIDEVEKEIEEKDKDTKQLVKDYKDLLMKQGTPEKPKDDIPSGKEPDFDTMLKEAVKNDNKKGDK